MVGGWREDGRRGEDSRSLQLSAGKQKSTRRKGDSRVNMNNSTWEDDDDDLNDHLHWQNSSEDANRQRGGSNQQRGSTNAQLLRRELFPHQVLKEQVIEKLKSSSSLSRSLGVTNTNIRTASIALSKFTNVAKRLKEKHDLVRPPWTENPLVDVAAVYGPGFVFAIVALQDPLYHWFVSMAFVACTLSLRRELVIGDEGGKEGNADESTGEESAQDAGGVGSAFESRNQDISGITLPPRRDENELFTETMLELRLLADVFELMRRFPQ
jgi:hypothetical protein